jgi:hypothetical protein
MTLQASQPELLPRRLAKKLLAALCFLILCGILLAGLSPFTPHLKNQVRWLDSQNGLYFGDYASILSVAPLHLDGPPNGPCSVELWLTPGLIEDSNTILAFQTPETPRQFSIRQNLSALMLTRQAILPHSPADKKLIYMDDVFRQDTPVLITVTAGAHATAVYLNGVLMRSEPDFGLTRHDLNGGIVVGNSPVVNDSWSGVMRGIGIYNRELTADEVRQDYEEWTRVGQLASLEQKNAVAVYPFTERSGKLIHSLVPSAVDLEIPDYYLVLYPPFLEPFWKNWGWNWAFWKDVLVNIAGFMPLGFCFCAYLSLSRPVPRAILLTILIGCVLSFIIESAQFYLPTRDSESIDFINNTLGTIFGVLLYRLRFVQIFLARLGIVALENSPVENAFDEPVLTAP